jgi:hypothetical protein
MRLRLNVVYCLLSEDVSNVGIKDGVSTRLQDERNQLNIKGPISWREWLLPKTMRIKWNWKRWLLFGFAISMLVDSFLVPFYGSVDPGGSGAGMLFLILGFRASSRKPLPTSVVVAGGCAAGLTWALNHQLLRSPSAVWTPLDILLVLVVALWGRKRLGHDEPSANSATADSRSELYLTDDRR